MATRAVPAILRVATRSARPTTSQITTVARRSFQTTAQRCVDATPLPVRKPVGAFRGSLYGFLLGSTLTSVVFYTYVLDEYKVSNELLTEDIYGLQNTVQRVHGYVQSLEEKIDALEKKSR